MGESTANSWIARRIGIAVREADITLKELGDRIGVSRPTIYAYASGTLRVSKKRLEQIASTLGKDVKYFLHEDYDENPDRFTEAVAIIDALLAPPDPVKAGVMALEWVGRTDDGESAAIRAEFQRRAGNALMLQGNYVEAISHLEEARGLFLAAEEVERAGACSQSLGYCHINIGRLSASRRAFEQSLLESEEADHWKGQVSLAALDEREGSFVESEAKLDALEFEVAADSIAHTYILANRASLACTTMNWHKVDAPAIRALSLSVQHNLLDQRIEIMGLLAYAALGRGEYEVATPILVRASDLAVGAKDHARQVWLDLAWAKVLMRIGEFSQARNRANYALAQSTRHQYRRSINIGLLTLGELALLEQDPNQALSFLLQAQADAKAHQYPAAEAQATALAAIAATLAGNKSEASDQLAAFRGQHLGEPRVHKYLAEFMLKNDPKALASGTKIADELLSPALRTRLLGTGTRECQVFLANDNGFTMSQLTELGWQKGLVLEKRK